MSILAGISDCSILSFHQSGDQPQLEDTLSRIYADLHEKQREFIDDTDHKILAVSAGYGAGKTRGLCAKALFLAAANQGFIGCVMEPTGPLIRDIWQNDFDDFLESYDIPYTFRASPLPEYVLHLPGGDTKILCRSFENWTRIIGLNLAWVLADEIDTVNKSLANKAFNKILGRLRSGNTRQFGVASTPEGYTWLYQTFGTEDAQNKEDRHLIRMRTVDNPHLPADFIETLRANYDPSLLKAYLEGEFVNLTTGTVYDRFSREKHVFADIADIEDLPLMVGIDFNIGNCNAVIGQMHNKQLVLFDEITNAHDTDALAQELLRRYPNRRYLGYPDASGSNRSTNATRTDIEILGRYGIVNQSPPANPPIRDRVAAMQAGFENGKGEIRIAVHERCRKLIESLELQCYTDKGEPDKESGFDHMNDACGYLVWRELNPVFARSGRSTGIRLY